MGHLRWDESPHWIKKIEAELAPPTIFRPKKYITRAQVEASVRDNPANNAINENQMWLLIDQAMARAEKNGTLAPEEEFA